MAPKEWKHISVKELHPTFGAEVSGVDFSRPVPQDVFNEIFEAMTEYGVCVFRKTGLDDDRHLEFSRLFGDLDNMGPLLKNYPDGYRHKSTEIFDVSNIDVHGNIAKPDSLKIAFSKGNTIFHADSSFNPRRAGYSLLLAHVIPPPGYGGETAFADSRTAFKDLSPEMKSRLISDDYTAAHSLLHSRKLASPEYFKDQNPEDHQMIHRKLIDIHEQSGRANLYLPIHVHHIEGLEPAESEKLIKELFDHVTQEKYTFEVSWNDPGDLIIWDNTAVLHRAKGGSYAGKYKRDLRRTTVHDASLHAWGLNSKGLVAVGLP